MAFEPKYSALTPAYPQRLAAGQAVVEARLLPAGYTVEKVLSASADVTVAAGETFTGEARYNGKATFRVLLLDGDGVYRSLDYVAEFSDKLTGSGITVNTQPFLSCNVLDTDIVLATASEIKLACVVEVCLMSVVTEQLHCLSDGGEGIYTHDDRLNYTRLSGIGHESHSYSDTISAAAADEILFCEPRAFVVKRIPDTDCITVEGIIVNDILVRCGEQVSSVRTETPFTAQLTAAGTKQSDICEVTVRVEQCGVELVTGENAAIACDYTLAFDYMAFTEDAENPVCDAFCVENELLIEGRTVTMPFPLGAETFFERVEGKITLDEAMPAADKISAACGSRLSITGAFASEGKLTVEGMAAMGIVYLSEEGQKASAAVELPFSITVSAPLKEGDEVHARGCVTNVEVKVRRSGELDVKADIAVEYESYRPESKYLIENIAIGEAHSLPTGAVSIHIARKGETLWEAAKALGTTPENVLLQNPDLTLPCAGGERVLTYRCLSKAE